MLHDEKVDYIRKQEHLKQHEITFDEVPGKELYKLLVFDEYEAEHEHFSLYGYDIAVKDTLLAEALKELSDRKRNVIFFNILIDSFLCWKIVLWTKFIFLAISASLISIK